MAHTHVILLLSISLLKKEIPRFLFSIFWNENISDH